MMNATPSDGLELFRSSVLVTGSHYSITTLIGMILAQSSQFHMLNEPVNRESTLSFRTVPMRNGYPLAEGAQYDELRSGLIRLIRAEGLLGDAARSVLKIRSLRDVGRIGRLLQHESPRLQSRRPAIIKAPLLAFTARTMQQVDSLKVVLGVRHPCAWIESVVRRDRGFDFSDLLQPPLLDALPDYADRIRLLASQRRPALEEALLMWQVLHAFHARYLLGNARTLMVRQADIVADPKGVARDLFEFAGVIDPPNLDRIIAENFTSAAVDFTPGKGNYLQRDAQAVLNKWRERLTVDDQLRIRREAGEVAAAFGYGETDWAA